MHYTVYKCDVCGKEFDKGTGWDCLYCYADICSLDCKERHLMEEHSWRSIHESLTGVSEMKTKKEIKRELERCMAELQKYVHPECKSEQLAARVETLRWVLEVQ